MGLDSTWMGDPSKELQVLHVMLHHYDVTIKPEKISLAPWRVLVIPCLGSKGHKTLGKLLSLREVWKVKIPCTDQLDECMGHQAT